MSQREARSSRPEVDGSRSTSKQPLEYRDERRPYRNSDPQHYDQRRGPTEREREDYHERKPPPRTDVYAPSNRDAHERDYRTQPYTQPYTKDRGYYDSDRRGQLDYYGGQYTHTYASNAGSHPYRDGREARDYRDYRDYRDPRDYRDQRDYRNDHAYRQQVRRSRSPGPQDYSHGRDYSRSERDMGRRPRNDQDRTRLRDSRSGDRTSYRGAGGNAYRSSKDRRDSAQQRKSSPVKRKSRSVSRSRSGSRSRSRSQSSNKSRSNSPSDSCSKSGDRKSEKSSCNSPDHERRSRSSRSLDESIDGQPIDSESERGSRHSQDSLVNYEEKGNPSNQHRSTESDTEGVDYEAPVAEQLYEPYVDVRDVEYHQERQHESENELDRGGAERGLAHSESHDVDESLARKRTHEPDYAPDGKREKIFSASRYDDEARRKQDHSTYLEKPSAQEQESHTGKSKENANSDFISKAHDYNSSSVHESSRAIPDTASTAIQNQSTSGPSAAVGPNAEYKSTSNQSRQMMIVCDLLSESKNNGVTSRILQVARRASHAPAPESKKVESNEQNQKKQEQFQETKGLPSSENSQKKIESSGNYGYQREYRNERDYREYREHRDYRDSRDQTYNQRKGLYDQTYTDNYGHRRQDSYGVTFSFLI